MFTRDSGLPKLYFQAEMVYDNNSAQKSLRQNYVFGHVNCVIGNIQVYINTASNNTTTVMFR